MRSTACTRSRRTGPARRRGLGRCGPARVGVGPGLAAALGPAARRARRRPASASPPPPPPRRRGAPPWPSSTTGRTSCPATPRSWTRCARRSSRAQPLAGVLRFAAAPRPGADRPARPGGHGHHHGPGRGRVERGRRGGRRLGRRRAGHPGRPGPAGALPDQLTGAVGGLVRGADPDGRGHAGGDPGIRRPADHRALLVQGGGPATSVPRGSERAGRLASCPARRLRNKSNSRRIAIVLSCTRPSAHVMPSAWTPSRRRQSGCSGAPRRVRPGGGFQRTA
jgi:hypothetical protein